MPNTAPTEAAIQAAVKAARTAIENYSEFDSSMIPDDALTTVVTQALAAGLAAQLKGS